MSGGHGKGKGKRHEEHEEHEEHVNHEAWVIPYADMLTLLMALFLVLFAMGRTDLEKFKKLAESLNREMGGGGSAQVVSLGNGTGESPLDGGTGVLENAGAEAPPDQAPTAGGTPTPLQIEQARQEAEREAAEAARDSLEELQDDLQLEADVEGVGDKIAFRFDGRGLVLTIVNDAVLFEAGQVTLQPDGVRILELVTAGLKNIPNHIIIEGHTDSRPINNARFRSNWDLSTARATSVLQQMIALGFDPMRLSAAGYADTRPVGDNATEEGRSQNRRVEIIIESDISLEPVLTIDG
jgi:chemotaxis protein MotB